MGIVKWDNSARLDWFSSQKKSQSNMYQDCQKSVHFSSLEDCHIMDYLLGIEAIANWKINTKVHLGLLW